MRVVFSPGSKAEAQARNAVSTVASAGASCQRPVRAGLAHFGERVCGSLKR